MSRIDQALRQWEAARGALASEKAPVRSRGSSALHQYSYEKQHGHTHEGLGPPPFVDSPELFSPASSPVQTTTSKLNLRENTEIDARLVTGTSSPVSLEQYRRLATVLHEEQVERQLKTVMITSALPQEGKTLTVVNLALTLSESYARRVLVIDADLRWPSLHTVLSIPNALGLSEALRDGEGDLPFVEVSSRLSALTAGTPGPTPLAGLTSKRMAEVIDACAARFDWVLIDTSPVGVLPDAQVLARLVGAVILVIGAGSTPAVAVERAVAELGPDSILGTVLNRVEERRVPQADYYGKYGTRIAGVVTDSSNSSRI
jgi:protein-tyrosine kinase